MWAGTKADVYIVTQAAIDRPEDRHYYGHTDSFQSLTLYTHIYIYIYYCLAHTPVYLRGGVYVGSNVGRYKSKCIYCNTGRNRQA
jgi:hypothetical protein